MIPPRGTPHNMVPVKIEEMCNIVYKRLNSALYLPGRVDGISMCVEYMYNWFVNKFIDARTEKPIFNAINLDGHDPFHDMMHWTIRDWVKRQRPKLSIIPKPDIQYNREFIDDDYNSIMGYINRTQDKNTFFKDKDNNVQLGLISRLNKVDFTYRIQVDTRAKQYDLYDEILMKCRVGKTISLHANIDFLVPSRLISRLAKDLHFEIDDKGMPVDYTAFLNYMNTYSVLPFMYKIRGVNHRYEFYMRVTEIIVHIRDISLDIDDGENEGMTHTNYGLEMTCTAYMPYPKYYVYWSEYETNHVMYRDSSEGDVVVSALVFTPIPAKNANGWPIYVDGEYESDNPNEPIRINLNDMFTTGGDVTQNDILDTIEYCRVRGVSPDVFMEIKVFNNMKEMQSFIDWTNMTLNTRTVPVKLKSNIVVYCDLPFVHNAMIDVHGHNRNRIF